MAVCPRTTRHGRKEGNVRHAAILLMSALAAPCPAQPTGGDTLHALLIPASTTMVTAWDMPQNPLTDSSLALSPRAERVRRGFRLFVRTPDEAPAVAANGLACGNCHLNAGQRERALPLTGVAGVFPEYNKREGRIFSLEDRIVGCFMRSENATAFRADTPSGGTFRTFPDTSAEEVAALAEYIRWISERAGVGKSLPWRGLNTIPGDSLIAIERLDPIRGKALFQERCSSCHGVDGQGVAIGDKKAGPLWGPRSWNDGAGAARVYTLAGFIRYAMPYLDPGSLNAEEAQQIARYINAMPRPKFPLKRYDYLRTRIPPDAVYYPRGAPERPPLNDH